VPKLTKFDLVCPYGKIQSTKSKVKVTLCERVPCLLASQSLITFQFHSLVVLLLDIVQERVSRHLALKGLML